jgi:hypothetical protein
MKLLDLSLELDKCGLPRPKTIGSSLSGRGGSEGRKKPSVNILLKAQNT